MDTERILSLTDESDAPEKLEALYREESGTFAEALPAALNQRPESILLRAWAARLAPRAEAIADKLELWLMVLFSILAGLAVKLPEIIPAVGDEYYFRSLVLGPIGAFIAYLLHTRNWPKNATCVVGGAFALIVLLLNLLPVKGDVFGLVLLHSTLVLWCVAAIAFAGQAKPSVEVRRAWVRFFGELVVFSGLLMLGGAILLAMTGGLFSLLDVSQEWILTWMLPMGVAAIPVVAAWAVVRRGGGGRVMPLLAHIFVPLFLVLLMAYLLRLTTDLGELFANRDTLLMYNILLLSVLGLTVFSLSGQSGQGSSQSRTLHLLLALLVGLTVLFDFVGLAAITSRILDAGFTPNRLAVLGSNLVVLGNLLLLCKGFIALLKGNAQAADLECTTARYLPVFAAWALIVTVVFPVVF